MVSIDQLRVIDEIEDRLILDFQQHLVFARMNEMSRAEILEILLQRRFLSLSFVPLYELALDALVDEPARQVVRSLIREEYGIDGGLTHREHLVHDLVAVGATRIQILRGRASKTTLNVAAELSEAVLREDEEEDDDAYQVSILATLRLAGEILVAIEYERFWPHLQRLGLSAQKAPGKHESKFYYPHMAHDSRGHPIASDPVSANNRNHADLMTDRLRERLKLTSATGLKACVLAARRAQRIKKSFYDQWLTT